MASFKGWLRQGMVCLFLLAGFALQAEELIYRVDIRDDIGPKTWRLARRAFAEAEQAGADKVIVNMNTYGGMVVYADSLRSLILNCAVPVWVFTGFNRFVCMIACSLKKSFPVNSYMYHKLPGKKPLVQS